MKKFFTAVALMGAISLTGCAEKESDSEVKKLNLSNPKQVYVTDHYTDGSEIHYTVTFESPVYAVAYSIQ